MGYISGGIPKLEGMLNFLTKKDLTTYIFFTLYVGIINADMFIYL